MPRRIDVELTSDRGDGRWTWRAPGAKQPKGDLDSALLPEGVGVGDVLRADAEFGLDGIDIVAVLPPKAKRDEPERLEILGSGRETPGVTTSRVERKGRGKGRKGRKGRARSEGGRAGGRPSPPPERPKKPKPPRLRAQRTHREAALAELQEAERPVAEQVLRGGIPAVRDAVRKQNEENRQAGRPPVQADAVVSLAEQLLPRLRAAEWRDRAEAALEQMETVDLRDLRSVVTAADAGARDDEARALADQLREGLAQRVERDHAAWLQELAETLADGRIARALNLSSRPPKAGAPLPRDLADRLATGASAALAADVGQKRWQTVLEAVARSPVRTQVEPEGIPSPPNDELLDAVRQVSMQVPQIAAAFGIEPQRPTRRRRGARKSGAERPAEQAAPPAKVAPRIPPPPPRPDEAPAAAGSGATPAPEPTVDAPDTGTPSAEEADGEATPGPDPEPESTGEDGADGEVAPG